MKDEVEIEVGPGGTIKTIYQEGIEDFAKEIGADITGVCRLSNVEWEVIGDAKGWSVRAAHNPEFALRFVVKDGQATFHVATEGDVILFNTRDDALRAESDHIWHLLPKKD